MSKNIAFGWYGGKFSHLDWLLPLLPKVQHYCEPFGGSAAVLINREPAPVETYNDLDGEVVNFFKVLRNQKDDLIEAIGLTPFSREEFELAIRQPINDLSDLERARQFFIRARQVRTGLAQKASVGRWAHCLLTSRAGMAGAVSRWLGSVEGLSPIAQRLLRVQIEHSPALEVIERYDSEQTLFYCDPPYPHESRGDKNAYAYEMNDDEHRKLAQVLHRVKGKVALSSYQSVLMEELYIGWHCIEAPEKLCHSVKTLRKEVLWVNYELEKGGRLPSQDLLSETIRLLLVIKMQNRQRLELLLEALRVNEADTSLPLSAEAIVKLIEQHLASPQSSRLPVLIVTAAYQAVTKQLGERTLPLHAHNAADEQTGAAGDVEITLTNSNRVVTIYEMKLKRVILDDIDRALQKLQRLDHKIDNYVFITTDVIDETVVRYATSLYTQTGGIEFVVLDCIGFLRHFLHLFHRLRSRFLEEYQQLLLTEPESAVRQSLKEAFLALRRAAETATAEISENLTSFENNQ